MRTPLENIRIFKSRREKILDALKGSALVVSATPEALRNGNVHHPFRTDSNVYYLSGIEEAETVFVFRPWAKPNVVAFVREKDPAMEIWDGFRFGPEGVEVQFQIEKAYPVSELKKQLPQLLLGADSIYYRQYRNPKMDQLIHESIQSVKSLEGKNARSFLSINDPEILLGQMRMIKTAEEIHNLKRACEITGEAHKELMKYVRPGISEREMHGYFIYQVLKNGAAREGYQGIFASGVNATILHYIFNDQTLKKGDLMLVDAGAEYNYFTSDVTRTFPIDKQWSPAQEKVYRGVLNIQKEIISMIKPGLPYQDMQERTIDLVTDLALDLGLLKGRKKDIIEARDYRKYYPHGVGHFLGMDVHDMGVYRTEEGSSQLVQESMVFTVEPGFYIPIDDKEAPPEFRGIGVRIEDDILVTHAGVEVLTKSAPKEIEEISRL